MALWLVRAGGNGEYESKFLSEKRIYVTWELLKNNLSTMETRQDLYECLISIYPDDKPNRIRNWAGQIWPFAKKMKPGDWVVLPSKKKASIHIGKITGDYVNDPSAEDPFYHYRTVDWFGTDIPRSNFDQDILYSFGAFLTICRISRNDAENRIRAMAKNNWKSQLTSLVLETADDIEDESAGYHDIERVARDQIAKYMTSKFKGHGMARIVEAILKAQNYVTYRSPEGPDKGIDLLAATGPLGFGSPKICVQVKTGDSPVDRPTLDQLIGAMQNFSAEQGLLVPWGGFKSSVDKEIPSQFFRVRLWDQDEIIEELLNAYDKIDEEIKADLPLKKIWALTMSEET
jgi:restriction system protein